MKTIVLIGLLIGVIAASVCTDKLHFLPMPTSIKCADTNTELNTL